jgi:ubiquinone/menaquinone biosynthesis C-methylase UbiE
MINLKMFPSNFDFGSMAEKYNSWYETAEGSIYDRLEKKAIAKFLPERCEGKKLLDAGCGTGHWSKFFSDKSFTVTGVDLSLSMIEVARNKNIKGASFGIADAHMLPFTENAFDVSAAITTLEFVRDPNIVVREMVRCTKKPGGVVIVGVLNASANINNRRKASGRQPYKTAQFFYPQNLKEILGAYGKTKVKTTTFVPQHNWSLPLSPIFDVVGKFLHLSNGAFIAGRIKL